jgi:cytochrome c peroxidase
MLGKWAAVFAACACVLGLMAVTAGAATSPGGLKPVERLGKQLFFDTRLSEPAGQSCATCHGPRVGYTGPDQGVNRGGAVYMGAAMGSWFGNRKPPAAAYAGGSPVLALVADEFTGGMFSDGSASGWRLDDPLAEQAGGPFLNVWEQNNPTRAVVVDKVSAGPYATSFTQVWGAHAFDDPQTAYDDICRSIAAYERSPEVSRFDSPFDTYLRTGKGLTAQAKLGLSLFKGKAKCSDCHVTTRDKTAGGVVFTDYTYADLGIPRNPENPWYHELGLNPAGTEWIDLGLGGFLASPAAASSGYAPFAAQNKGKFKVPTLRNIDKRPTPGFVKAYGHNGAFKSLEEVVHFLNTRDVPGAGWKGVPWPAPEYAATMETKTVGRLGLTAAQEKAIVAFLKTLTDR